MIKFKDKKRKEIFYDPKLHSRIEGIYFKLREIKGFFPINDLYAKWIEDGVKKDEKELKKRG